MALASPFFGKREPEPVSPVAAPYSPQSNRHLNSSLKTEPVHNLTNTNLTQTNISQTGQKVEVKTASTEGGSRLIVGPNIKLKGVEITDCDTLVVEGTVEATMDSRVIQIMANGTFKGSADIDIAEIHGQFDGNFFILFSRLFYFFTSYKPYLRCKFDTLLKVI